MIFIRKCVMLVPNNVSSQVFFCDVCRVEVLLLPLNEHKFIVSFAL